MRVKKSLSRNNFIKIRSLNTLNTKEINIITKLNTEWNGGLKKSQKLLKINKIKQRIFGSRNCIPLLHKFGIDDIETRSQSEEEDLNKDFKLNSTKTVRFLPLSYAKF